MSILERIKSLFTGVTLIKITEKTQIKPKIIKALKKLAQIVLMIIGFIIIMVLAAIITGWIIKGMMMLWTITTEAVTEHVVNPITEAVISTKAEISRVINEVHDQIVTALTPIAEGVKKGIEIAKEGIRIGKEGFETTIAAITKVVNFTKTTYTEVTRITGWLWRKAMGIKSADEKSNDYGDLGKHRQPTPNKKPKSTYDYRFYEAGKAQRDKRMKRGLRKQTYSGRESTREEAPGTSGSAPEEKNPIHNFIPQDKLLRTTHGRTTQEITKDKDGNTVSTNFEIEIFPSAAAGTDPERGRTQSRSRSRSPLGTPIVESPSPRGEDPKRRRCRSTA